VSWNGNLLIQIKGERVKGKDKRECIKQFILMTSFPIPFAHITYYEKKGEVKRECITISSDTDKRKC
jgi:hypothetical protein